MGSTWFLRVLFCFIRSLWHWGLHTPQRRTYLRKTDFYTQRVVDRKETPWSLNIVALQVPPISSLPISLVALLELKHTDLKEPSAGSCGLRSGAIHGTCTESTIPTRGRETQTFGLKPDIILYRNRTINIYKYIYNYDWLYICTITHRYIHSFKGILLKGFILLIYQP